MKKIYLVILAAMATLAATAQAPVGDGWAKKQAPIAALAEEQPRCDSIVQKDHQGNRLQRIVNRYAADGSVASRLYEVYDALAAAYSPSELYSFEYDDYGNVSVTVYAKWDAAAGRWANQQRVEEDYNAMGLKTSQRNYTWQDGQWTLISRGDATYDEQGHELSNITRDWGGPEVGWTKIKNEYTYNEQGLCTSATYFGLVAGDAEFVPTFRTSYDYTEAGQMTLRFTQDWDAAQAKFTDTMKEEWTYDGEGNQTLYTSYYKDFNTGELAPMSKREMGYDGRDNMLTTLSYTMLPGGGWTLQGKDEYTYDANDSVLTKTTYSAVYGSTELKADVLWTYEYDEAGNCTLFLTQYMGEDGRWVNMTKDEKAYDEAGNMTSQRKYNWAVDAATGDYHWLTTFKGDYAFDEAGRMLSIEELNYDMMQGRWAGMQKSETEYDAHGNTLKETIYQWVDAQQRFVLAGTVELFYSLPTGIVAAKAGAEGFRISTDGGSIRVVFAGAAQPVAIYSMSGRKVAGGPVATGLVPGQAYIVAVGNGYRCKVVAR